MSKNLRSLVIVTIAEFGSDCPLVSGLLTRYQTQFSAGKR